MRRARFCRAFGKSKWTRSQFRTDSHRRYQDNTNLSEAWQRLVNQNERAKASEKALTRCLSGKHLIRTARFKCVLKVADFRLARFRFENDLNDIESRRRFEQSILLQIL